MEIQFTKQDELWVAEFEVTNDFNLHIERDTAGRLDIYQRTAGGKYEYIYDLGYLNARVVYDDDFQALVYPKWIKIKSAVKPLIATITTDGEVNEVVYQAKEIEITSNGTTKVTADTGYTALGSVNVKVNVPTEGGGEEGDNENTVYINIEGLDNETQFLQRCASLIKLFNGDIMPPGLFSSGSVIAVGINPSDRVIKKMEPEFDGTVEQLLQEMVNVDLSTMPFISKEEFYSTPKPTIIIETEGKSLTLDGETGTVIKNNGYNITTNNGKVEQVRITTSDSWIAINANFAFNLPTTSANLLASTTTDNMNHYIEILGSGTAQYQFVFGALTISVS